MLLLLSIYNHKFQVLSKSNDFENLVFMASELISERTIPQVQKEYHFKRSIMIENSTCLTEGRPFPETLLA
jgi:hypothetical protein